MLCTYNGYSTAGHRKSTRLVGLYAEGLYESRPLETPRCPNLIPTTWLPLATNVTISELTKLVCSSGTLFARMCFGNALGKKGATSTRPVNLDVITRRRSLSHGSGAESYPTPVDRATVHPPKRGAIPKVIQDETLTVPHVDTPCRNVHGICPTAVHAVLRANRRLGDSVEVVLDPLLS